MQFDTVNVDLDELTLLIPSNIPEFFKPQPPHFDAIAVFSIFHALIQKRYDNNELLAVNVNLNNVADQMHMTKYRIKDQFNQIEHRHLASIKHLDGDIFQVEIPNFERWNQDQEI